MADAQKSLDVQIRTSTELQGAEQAVEVLEKQIGKARSLGQEYSHLEQKLDRVRVAIEQYKQAQQGEISNMGEIHKGSQEIAASVKVMGEEDVKSATAGAAATAQNLLGKKNLRAAISGLALQFPLLGRIARSALNPISLAVTAAIGAFTIWKRRMEEVNQVLTGMQLPDVSEKQVGTISAAADAWNKYREALEGVARAYNSVQAASDREMARLHEELDQRKQLLAAQKEAAIAKLDSQKGSMTGTAYTAQRLGIEQSFAAAGLRLEQSGREAELDLQRKRKRDLERDAAQKLEEAGGITLASADFDAETLERLKAQKDAAIQARDEARKRLVWIEEQQSPGTQSPGVLWQWRMRYGSLTAAEAIALERDTIDRAGSVVERHDSFVRQRPHRDAERDRRGRLMGESGQAAGEASVLGQSIPEQEAANARRNQVSEHLVGTRSVGGLYSALGESQAARERMEAEMMEAVKAGNQTNRALVRELEESIRLQRALEQTIRRMEAENKRRHQSLLNP